MSTALHEQTPEALPADPGPRALELAASGLARAAQQATATTESKGGSGENVSDRRADIAAFYDRLIATPSMRSPDGAENLEKYKGAYTDLATSLFDGDLLGKKEAYERDYNPLLSELGSILASLDHNAGVYYASEDVESLFGAIAHGIFDDEPTKKQLSDIDPTDTQALRDVIEARFKAVSSVNKETALALVRSEGEWKVADAREYSQAEDFVPLEALRQDNADKSGWSKYRFRAPTYTRQRTDAHHKEVADGWYASEWHEEPNYWSAQVRETLAVAAREIGEQLKGSSASVVFVAEGGVFKGTATAGTDLDTDCKIICDSKEEFEQTYQVVSRDLSDRVDALPFGVKKTDTPSISISFYDRSSGIAYYRDGDGVYRGLRTDALEDGEVVDEVVRRHEKGVFVATPQQVTLFRKPKELDNKGEVGTAISIDSGEVRQTPVRTPSPVAAPKQENKTYNDWI